MHNELTQIDIDKMQEEIEYRKVTLRHELLEEVKVARAFGDLSENFEYKEAKRKKNQNESRIRYLTNMIKTAKIIEDHSDETSVGLFDKVVCFIEDEAEEMTVQIVTTIRNDVENGLVSKESPLGKSILGKRIGERVEVLCPAGNYFVKIQSITKAADDGSSPITAYYFVKYEKKKISTNFS